MPLALNPAHPRRQTAVEPPPFLFTSIKLPLPQLPADFGPAIPDSGLEGLLYLANPQDACSTLTTPPGAKGKRWVALIKRTQGLVETCTFDRKVPGRGWVVGAGQRAEHRDARVGGCSKYLDAAGQTDWGEMLPAASEGLALHHA